MGAQADLGLGPLTLTSNAGFETLRADDEVLGDFWYEPLPEGEVIVQPVEDVEPPQQGGSQYFGLQVWILALLRYRLIITFDSGRRGGGTPSLECRH